MHSGKGFICRCSAALSEFLVSVLANNIYIYLGAFIFVFILYPCNLRFCTVVTQISCATALVRCSLFTHCTERTTYQVKLLLSITVKARLWGDFPELWFPVTTWDKQQQRVTAFKVQDKDLEIASQGCDGWLRQCKRRSLSLLYHLHC